MGQLFLSVLDLSAKASILIIAVVFLRLIFKKAPRRVICLLWMLVGLRLVVPFSIESTLSLIPSAAPVSSRVELDLPYTELILPDVPVQEMPVTTPTQPAVTVPDTPVYIPEQNISAPQQVTPQPVPMSADQIAAIVWLCGLAAMLVYLALSYLLLRVKVAKSYPMEDGVWYCPGLASPFVLGIFRPRIYLSGTMDKAQTAYVLSHERAHIARLDHWTKPIGFVILALHWFNPLVWLSYILLCRDIELACDERVVKNMDLTARKGYSQALLACSVRSNPLAACPLAFGEVGVKQRIKSVLSYKKPAFWVIIAAVLCMIAAAVLFMTDPREDTKSPEEYTAALLEQHRDRLYLSDLEIDRDSLFESYTEDTNFEIFYPNGENFCSTTNTDNVYYWHDQSGKATPELAATALIGVMLQSVNSLPESQRSFTVLDYHVAEQSLTSWDDMPSRLLDGYPIDIEGLGDAEALEEIDRVFAEHLAMEQDLFGFDAFVMDLDADMWVFDPEFTFEFEGLCNLYRREEMEKYGLIAENGLCLEAQQGSDSYFVHILIKNGDVWRMQRLNGLIEYIAADGEVTETPAVDADTLLIRREDLVTGEVVTNETTKIVHFDDIASRAVEIVNSGMLIEFTSEELEHRDDGLTVAYTNSVMFFDKNSELSLWLFEDALGYVIFIGGKAYYIEDAELLKELELLMLNAGQTVYLDHNDVNEYTLSNKLCIGMTYRQVKLVMGEPVSIEEESGTPDGLTVYCLNYRDTAKLHMLGGEGAAVEECTLQFIQYYGFGVETARGISPGDSRSDVYDAYGRADAPIADLLISSYFEPNDAGYSSVMSLRPGQVSIWDATWKAPYAMYFLFSGETLGCIYVRPAEYTAWVPAMTSPDLSIPEGTAYDPGMFYPLQVPIGTSIAADLDGDGTEELIYQNFKSNGDVKLSINGIDMSDAIEEFGVRIEWLNRECYYITDIERTDGRLEITVSEAYGGTHFFQYDGESLVYLGAIPNQVSNLRFDGDSYVLGSFRLRVLHTWYGGAAWRYADGELQFIEQDFYHAVSGPGFDMVTGQELVHYYALCDFYVYPSKNLDRDPLVISEGTQFDLLGTDNVEWVLLQTLSGEQYWLYCGNYSIATPNGDVDYAGHVIMGLSFAN